MRYFDNLDYQAKSKVFYKLPNKYNKNSSKETLKYSLGATLYVPATKDNFDSLIITRKYNDINTFIIDLEDSIGDSSVSLGEGIFYKNIRNIKKAVINGIINPEDIPLIFLRVRNYEQFKYITSKIIEDINILTGFVIPKVSGGDIFNYLKDLEDINTKKDIKLYAMPTLECRRIGYKDKRIEYLTDMVQKLTKYKDIILNIRIGVTDFSSMFGLRRREDTIIYDMVILKDIISDILNIMLRSEHEFVVSGCVYEYYNFKDGDVSLKTFLKEIYNDKLNGLVGKTIIHPSQAKYVQAMSIVDYEDYMDAKRIVNASYDICGAESSFNKNRMNEIKPHMKWAEKIICLSKVYGVYNHGESYKSLL